MIRDDGFSAVTMRKLADSVGVSRTALYHHFANKHELLCALAEEGFKLSKMIGIKDGVSDLSPSEQFKHHIYQYIRFALENPESYDLMYGRDIWKTENPTDSLKKESYEAFRHYLSLVKYWQQEGVIDKNKDPLRFAQVSWSTLHGMSRLLIDGVYEDTKSVDDMCAMAVRVLLNQS